MAKLSFKKEFEKAYYSMDVDTTTLPGAAIGSPEQGIDRRLKYLAGLLLAKGDTEDTEQAIIDESNRLIDMRTARLINLPSVRHFGQRLR